MIQVTLQLFNEEDSMSASAKVDTALQIYDALSNTLKVSGLSDATAKKYACFAVDIYQYIRDRPDLQNALQGARSTYDLGTGAAKYLTASRLATNAAAGGFSAAGKLASKANVAAGGPISAFVDCFVAVAKARGIEMNECTIAVTKVMLDVLATIALAETVVGIWAAAMQSLAAGADTKDMIHLCMGVA